MTTLQIRGAPWLFTDGWYEGPVTIANGRIAGLGVACPDVTLDLGAENVVALPGLVNGHDHLDFGEFPLMAARAPYQDYVAWAEDVTERRKAGELATFEKLPLARRLVSSAIRNLRSGVTAVGHMNPYLRRVFRRSAFPLRVLGEGRLFHSMRFGGDLRAFVKTIRGRRYMAHVAEGTGPHAADELRCFSEAGALGPHAILIHGLGLSRTDAGRIRDTGATLVLCPRSNETLYGVAPDVAMLLEERVSLALGSDSPISGPGDLLDDLAAARRLGLPVEASLSAVTRIPAKAFGCSDLGLLAVDGPADVLFAAAADPSLTLGRPSVVMVMCAGIPRYASRPALVAAAAGSEERFDEHAWLEPRLARWARKLGVARLHRDNAQESSTPWIAGSS